MIFKTYIVEIERKKKVQLISYLGQVTKYYCLLLKYLIIVVTLS